MVATYKNAIATQREVEKGLTTTHQGGQAYQIDPFKQLRRFLILGSEGGTFYVSEQKLTDYNVQAVRKALAVDPIRTINEIVDVSERGLAPKNDPALLALALATTVENDEVRAYAYSVLPRVARTGTHLFHFAEYAHGLRGWGAGLRRAIGRWYTDRSTLSLANQITKYQQRDGWSHRDLLRLAHPQAKSTEQNTVFKYIVDDVLPEFIDTDQKAVRYLYAVECVKQAEDTAEIINLIRDFKLPREVPIQEMKLAAKDRPMRPEDYWDRTRRSVTASFNCRPATGSTTLSQHSYGWAIDINPLQNPYVRNDGTVLRHIAKPFRNRSLQRKGMIHEGDVVVRSFARIGWEWGGHWHTLKDYMHFSLTGR